MTGRIVVAVLVLLYVAWQVAGVIAAANAGCRIPWAC